MLSQAALVFSAATLAAAQWPSCEPPDNSALSSLAHRLDLADAPALVSCPSNSVLERTGNPISGNQTLFGAEAAYLQNRRTNVLPNLWQQYLQDNATGSTGYDVMQIVQNTPNL